MRANKWLVIRISKPTQRGLPDVLAISIDGVIVALEFKTNTKQTHLQQLMQVEFEKRNIKYYVIKSIDELKNIIKKHCSQ